MSINNIKSFFTRTYSNNKPMNDNINNSKSIKNFRTYETKFNSFSMNKNDKMID